MNNYGYQEPIIEEEDFIFGGKSITEEVLQRNGHGWLDFKPLFEPQSRGNIETNGCTQYNTLNPLETLLKRQFNEEYDYSERGLGISAGTDPNSGNNPKKICDTIRHKGLFVENLLPFNDTIKTVEEYYSPNPLTFDLVDLGEEWVEKWDFGYEYVKTPNDRLNHDTIINALQYSPLGVSVVAWAKNEEELYTKPEGMRDNHWTGLFDYKYGSHWLIYDSYDESIKKLEWNYAFGFIQRYSLKKRVKKINWWTEFFMKLWR